MDFFPYSPLLLWTEVELSFSSSIAQLHCFTPYLANGAGYTASNSVIAWLQGHSLLLISFPLQTDRQQDRQTDSNITWLCFMLWREEADGRRKKAKVEEGKGSERAGLNSAATQKKRIALSTLRHAFLSPTFFRFFYYFFLSSSFSLDNVSSLFSPLFSFLSQSALSVCRPAGFYLLRILNVFPFFFSHLLAALPCFLVNLVNQLELRETQLTNC